MVIIWRLYSRKTSSLLNEVCVFSHDTKKEQESMLRFKIGIR